MSNGIESIRGSTSVMDSVRLMNEKNIGALIIVDDEGHTSGIFTERDLLRKVVATRQSLDEPVSTFMTRDLICAQCDDSADDMARRMLIGNFRHIPVLDGFEPIGILSIRDVLRHISDKGQK